MSTVRVVSTDVVTELYEIVQQVQPLPSNVRQIQLQWELKDKQEICLLEYWCNVDREPGKAILETPERMKLWELLNEHFHLPPVLTSLVITAHAGKTTTIKCEGILTAR